MAIIHKEAYCRFSSSSFLPAPTLPHLFRLPRLVLLQLCAVMRLQSSKALLSLREGFLPLLIDFLLLQFLALQYDEKIIFFPGENNSRCGISLRKTPYRQWLALRVSIELYLESRNIIQGYMFKDYVQKQPFLELCNRVLSGLFFFAGAV